MAINLMKCAAASIIVKSCYQQSMNGSQSKLWGYEKQDKIQKFRTHSSGEGIIEDESNFEKGKNEEVTKCRGTQTDYRESETQTLPWEAPYKLSSKANADPEVLNLGNLTWGNGLPAGAHEVQIIKRMRMKKAWLKILPPMDSPANIKACQSIISAIEANEWAFREAEIQFVMDTRMELMERIKEDYNSIKKEKVSQRLERFTNRLSQQRDDQIHAIRKQFTRDVRKLNRKHRGSSATFHKLERSNIIENYANPCSYLYAPETRFGLKCEGRHENLDKKILAETCVDSEIRAEDSTTWLPTDQELYKLRSIPRPDDLCPHRTRWTDENLQKLHADLKAIRLNATKQEKKEKSSLLKRKVKQSDLPVTPLKRRSDNDDNNLENNYLLIQKITRGRAVQCMMFEGRERCRKLIEELRSSHPYKDSDQTFHRKAADIDTFVESHDAKTFMQDNRLSETLDSLEGLTVAGMLDTLSKEETRLREERKAHAVVLLVERERNRREAEEGGRRQLERNRRRELDEMFRQIVKVNQDSVQVYLEDIINEGIEWVSDQDAKRYVEELADKIDVSMSESNENNSDPMKDQEMISDMVHNFLLPEVDKEMMRKKIRQRQQRYLLEARRMIYKEVTNLRTSEKGTEMSEISLHEQLYEDDTNEEERENEFTSEDSDTYTPIEKFQ